MDFSNSVILPREDFIELQEAAWNQPPTPFSDRLGQTAQTAMFVVILTSAFAAGTYAWYKMMSKLEEKKHEQKIAEIEADANRFKK